MPQAKPNPRTIQLPESGIIDVHKLAMEIFNGKVTPKKLPRDVYFYNANILKAGVYKGFGVPLSRVQYLSPDYKLLSHLRNNIYIFSAAKTWQQTVAMTNALVTGTTIMNFKEFQERVQSISDEYNKTWLLTEYDTAIGQAQSASSWNRYEEQKSVLPLLTKVVTEDEVTCEICAPLDGYTAYVDDPVWDSIAGMLHFNCRCYEEQHEESDATVTDDPSLIEKQTGKMDEIFKTNPGKTGDVFNKDHPYFSIPKAYKDFGKENFGLPIPDHD